MRSGLIRDCVFPWSDVCAGTEINSVGWQQMDCALSHCLTKAFPSLCAVQTGKVVSLFSLREWMLSVLLMCAYKPLSPKMRNAPFLLIHVCTLPLTFFFFNFQVTFDLDLNSIAISHILSYRGILYRAASLYACSSPNNYVTTELFVMVHVCQHFFCRALFPITSISICRITNKCE